MLRFISWPYIWPGPSLFESPPVLTMETLTYIRSLWYLSLSFASMASSLKSSSWVRSGSRPIAVSIFMILKFAERKERSFGHVRPARIWISLRQAKIRISLRIRAVWSESSLSTFLCNFPSCGQRSVWSDCADAQADLSLRCAIMSGGTSSYVAAQIMKERRFEWVKAWQSLCY